jgi:hypothetical protein
MSSAGWIGMWHASWCWMALMDQLGVKSILSALVKR